MSKIEIVSCKISEVNSLILEQAIKKILSLFDGRLTILDKNRFQIYCSKLSCYGVTIEIVDQQIKIRGEETNINMVKEIVEQFYEAMRFEDLPNCTNVEVEKEDLLLTIEV